ncbi:MAG: leucine-rich repeat domain-containing protein [Erysipelotrichaceae bacterium]|jgi:hypothetical protein|nr:leucine-rich repeat domain-containing protein [Erysipelotrichaceae bacterium]
MFRIRKIAALVVLSFALFGCGTEVVQQETSGDFSFTINDAENPEYYALSGYTGNEDTVTLPTTHNSLPVREVASQAFSGHNTIKTIVITASYTTIFDDAFSNMPLLETVSFEEDATLAIILDYAFANNPLLKEINLPTSIVSLGRGIFKNCLQLETISIPHFVDIDQGVFIPEETFMGCVALKTVGVSSTLSMIGTRAFEGCTSLVNFMFRDTITTISDYAFANSGLTDRFICPQGLMKLGEGAFFSTTITDIVFNATFSALTTRSLLAMPNLRTITFGALFSEFAPFAIVDCPNVTEIILDGNLNFSIENNLLFDASGAELIYVTPSIKTINITKPRLIISEGAFYASQIETLVLNGTISLIINELAFKEAVIGTITLNGVITMRNNAFSSSEISSISLLGTTIIGNYAFSDVKLSVIDLTHVTYVGVGAFYNWDGSQTIRYRDATNYSTMWRFGSLANFEQIT